jgi:uncharacterized protein YecE (DUF72 family)
MATIYAGTSGFAYPAWKPGFYPADVPATRFLEHYASRLTCVEINYTFRHVPSQKTLESWIAATPAGFVFAVKAHQRITHLQRLKDAGEATSGFLAALQPLRDAGRLGPVLFQLPPNLAIDVPRLAAFLELLPASGRFAIEFRHPSWFIDDVYGLLRAHNVALCLAQSEKLEVPEVFTADFVYYRLRKPTYSAAEIERFAAGSRRQLAAGRDLYVLLKHEDDPSGALQAERLLAAA